MKISKSENPQTFEENRTVAQKGGEIAGHGDALFLSLHESAQAFRNLKVDAEDAVNRRFELRRMRRFEEDACLRRLKPVFQSLISASAMWIKNLAIFLIHIAHGFGNLLVRIAGGGYLRTNGGMDIAFASV